MIIRILNCYTKNDYRLYFYTRLTSCLLVSKVVSFCRSAKSFGVSKSVCMKVRLLLLRIKEQVSQPARAYTIRKSNGFTPYLSMNSLESIELVRVHWESSLVILDALVGKSSQSLLNILINKD